MKQKRLYFILTDENIFHPTYFAGLTEDLTRTYKIVGVTVLKEKFKNGFLFYLYQQYSLWGLLGFFSIPIMSILRKFLSQSGIKKNHSIKTIALKAKIPYIEINNVNSQKHLDYLQKKSIDIIISSCGQIFKENLLHLPKIACINRHTALLPAYGGVLPVFWAMYNHEKKIGVSVHLMTEKVDQGDTLSQEKINFKPCNSLFRNYILGFKKSVAVTLKALDNLEQKKIIGRFYPNKKQYFSFPHITTMKEFRKKNKSFTLADALYLFKTTFL